MQSTEKTCLQDIQVRIELLELLEIILRRW